MVLAQPQPELRPRMNRTKDAKSSLWPTRQLYLESSGQVSGPDDTALHPFSLSLLRGVWSLRPLPFSRDFLTRWRVAG